MNRDKLCGFYEPIFSVSRLEMNISSSPDDRNISLNGRQETTRWSVQARLNACGQVWRLQQSKLHII